MGRRAAGVGMTSLNRRLQLVFSPRSLWATIIHAALRRARRIAGALRTLADALHQCISFLAISAGGSHTCGVQMDGSLSCFGSNGFGQTTVPTGVSIVQAPKPPPPAPRSPPGSPPLPPSFPPSFPPSTPPKPPPSHPPSHPPPSRPPPSSPPPPSRPPPPAGIPAAPGSPPPTPATGSPSTTTAGPLPEPENSAASRLSHCSFAVSLGLAGAGYVLLVGQRK